MKHLFIKLLNDCVHILRREHVSKHKVFVDMVNASDTSQLANIQLDKLKQIISLPLGRSYLDYADLTKVLGESNFTKPYELLNELPYLEKSFVRERQKELQFGWYDSLWLDWRTTSGSTGSPCGFYKGRYATGFMQAVQDNAYAWHGISGSDLQGYFWGGRNGTAGKVAVIKDFIKNRVRLSAFDTSDAAFKAFYEKICKQKVVYFYGYPSLILEFLRYLRREKLSLANLSLKAIIGTGEFVFPHEKQEIEGLTDVPFISEYGCTEVGLIGLTCEHGNCHVLSSNIVVEVVDENGKQLFDQEGEIVVTELNSDFYPFVRYKIGDRGILSFDRCKCGRILPILRVLSGRKDDFIITPEGNKIYDAIFAYTFKYGVDRFYAKQIDSDMIVVQVEINDDFSSDLIDKYIKTFKNSISKNITYEIVIVDKIIRKSSGKMSYFERLDF